LHMKFKFVVDPPSSPIASDEKGYYSIYSWFFRWRHNRVVS